MTNKYASIIEKLHGGNSDSLPLRSPLAEAHLTKIESQLGSPLPQDYREFLRDYAGFEFESVSFSFRTDGSPREGDIDNFTNSTDDETLADTYNRILKIFIPVTRGQGHEVYPGIHLVRDVPSPVTELGWPEELLPIGYDVAGNDICLALFGLHPGAIFYWMQGDDIYLIADSFDEFMQLLHPV